MHRQAFSLETEARVLQYAIGVGNFIKIRHRNMVNEIDNSYQDILYFHGRLINFEDELYF